jgi:hypothetical protein
VLEQRDPKKGYQKLPKENPTGKSSGFKKAGQVFKGFLGFGKKTRRELDETEFMLRQAVHEELLQRDPMEERKKKLLKGSAKAIGKGAYKEAKSQAEEAWDMAERDVLDEAELMPRELAERELDDSHSLDARGGKTTAAKYVVAGASIIGGGIGLAKLAEHYKLGDKTRRDVDELEELLQRGKEFTKADVEQMQHQLDLASEKLAQLLRDADDHAELLQRGKEFTKADVEQMQHQLDLASEKLAQLPRDVVDQLVQRKNAPTQADVKQMQHKLNVVSYQVAHMRRDAADEAVLQRDPGYIHDVVHNTWNAAALAAGHTPFRSADRAAQKAAQAGRRSDDALEQRDPGHIHDFVHKTWDKATSAASYPTFADQDRQAQHKASQALPHRRSEDALLERDPNAIKDAGVRAAKAAAQGAIKSVQHDLNFISYNLSHRRDEEGNDELVQRDPNAIKDAGTRAAKAAAQGAIKSVQHDLNVISYNLSHRRGEDDEQLLQREPSIESAAKGAAVRAGKGAAQGAIKSVQHDLNVVSYNIGHRSEDGDELLSREPSVESAAKDAAVRAGKGAAQGAIKSVQHDLNTLSNKIGHRSEAESVDERGFFSDAKDKYIDRYREQPQPESLRRDDELEMRSPGAGKIFALGSAGAVALVGGGMLTASLVKDYKNAHKHRRDLVDEEELLQREPGYVHDVFHNSAHAAHVAAAHTTAAALRKAAHAMDRVQRREGEDVEFEAREPGYIHDVVHNTAHEAHRAAALTAMHYEAKAQQKLDSLNNTSRRSEIEQRDPGYIHDVVHNTAHEAHRAAALTTMRYQAKAQQKLDSLNNTSRRRAELQEREPRYPKGMNAGAQFIADTHHQAHGSTAERRDEAELQLRDPRYPKGMNAGAQWSANRYHQAHGNTLAERDEEDLEQRGLKGGLAVFAGATTLVGGGAGLGAWLDSKNKHKRGLADAELLQERDFADAELQARMSKGRMAAIAAGSVLATGATAGLGYGATKLVNAFKHRDLDELSERDVFELDARDLADEHDLQVRAGGDGELQTRELAELLERGPTLGGKLLAGMTGIGAVTAVGFGAKALADSYRQKKNGKRDLLEGEEDLQVRADGQLQERGAGALVAAGVLQVTAMGGIGGYLHHKHVIRDLDAEEALQVRAAADGELQERSKKQIAKIVAGVVGAGAVVGTGFGIQAWRNAHHQRDLPADQQLLQVRAATDGELVERGPKNGNKGNAATAAASSLITVGSTLATKAYRNMHGRDLEADEEALQARDPLIGQLSADDARYFADAHYDGVEPAGHLDARDPLLGKALLAGGGFLLGKHYADKHKQQQQQPTGATGSVHMVARDPISGKKIVKYAVVGTAAKLVVGTAAWRAYQNHKAQQDGTAPAQRRELIGDEEDSQVRDPFFTKGAVKDLTKFANSRVDAMKTAAANHRRDLGDDEQDLDARSPEPFWGKAALAGGALYAYHKHQQHQAAAAAAPAPAAAPAQRDVHDDEQALDARSPEPFWGKAALAGGGLYLYHKHKQAQAAAAPAPAERDLGDDEQALQARDPFWGKAALAGGGLYLYHKHKQAQAAAAAPAAPAERNVDADLQARDPFWGKAALAGGGLYLYHKHKQAQAAAAAPAPAQRDVEGDEDLQAREPFWVSALAPAVSGRDVEEVHARDPFWVSALAPAVNGRDVSHEDLQARDPFWVSALAPAVNGRDVSHEDLEARDPFWVSALAPAINGRDEDVQARDPFWVSALAPAVSGRDVPTTVGDLQYVANREASDDVHAEKRSLDDIQVRGVMATASKYIAGKLAKPLYHMYAKLNDRAQDDELAARGKWKDAFTIKKWANQRRSLDEDELDARNIFQDAYHKTEQVYDNYGPGHAPQRRSLDEDETAPRNVFHDVHQWAEGTREKWHLTTTRRSPDETEVRGLGRWVGKKTSKATKHEQPWQASLRRSPDGAEVRGLGKWIGKKIGQAIKHEAPFHGGYFSRRADTHAVRTLAPADCAFADTPSPPPPFPPPPPSSSTGRRARGARPRPLGQVALHPNSVRRQRQLAPRPPQPLGGRRLRGPRTGGRGAAALPRGTWQGGQVDWQEGGGEAQEGAPHLRSAPFSFSPV